ncbi:MAG: patatin-like phospholipase family protein [Okeania sp. SIO3B5]|uniref:patatin-like phospholipase family protein n=1 Tax=Okeania sp. SIO3B5 TaxID=2607811 RepID=UPI0013FFAF48|nr:patatin-like phospholipase family protein [Okeania sp. SIO3B5]NEO51868.1 patatin-like phospholipase family protein [Okeania sp. SIO3B5]
MTFKILSLDGGGIRGVIAARILIEIEKQIKEQKGQSLHQYFDLVAGTSTGSIIATLVATGTESANILKLYQEEGINIFPYQSRLSPKRLPLILKYGISAPKFSNEGLIKVLKKYFLRQDGTAIRLQEINEINLLIVAYNMFLESPTIFVNNHPEIPKQTIWYDNLPLWEICASSSSAPTYFPAYELKNGDLSLPHIDGGIAANNPTLAAISHGIKLGHKLEDISIISIGTGETSQPYSYKQIVEWGLAEWAIKLIDILMNSQSSANSLVAEQIMSTKNPEGYLRLQFELNNIFQQGTNKKKVINSYINEKVSEAIDDAREPQINQLIRVTEAFIEQGKVAYVDLENQVNYPLVKEAIARFINLN